MDATRTFPVTQQYKEYEADYDKSKGDFPNNRSWVWYLAMKHDGAKVVCGDKETQNWTVSHVPEVIKTISNTRAYDAAKGDDAVGYTIWVNGATRFATNSHKEWEWYANEYSKPPRPCARVGMYDSAYKKHDFDAVPWNDNVSVHVNGKEFRKIAVDEAAVPALFLVAQERQRQMQQEGWTTDHDDGHNGGELARAAAAYIIPYGQGRWPYLWPWDWSCFKPAEDHHNKEHRIRELVKGAALACAEIDRLLRMEGNTL